MEVIFQKKLRNLLQKIFLFKYFKDKNLKSRIFGGEQKIFLGTFIGSSPGHYLVTGQILVIER